MLLPARAFGDGAGEIHPANLTVPAPATMDIMAVDLMVGATADTGAVLMAAAVAVTAAIECLPKFGERRIQPGMQQNHFPVETKV